MKRYYHRKYYPRGNSDFSLRQYLRNILQAAAGLIGLVIFAYIFPAYIYVIDHPIILIPIGIGVAIIAWWIYYYLEHRKKISMRAISKFNEIMKLNPREFEEFIEEMFRNKWFQTVLGKWTKDWWVDVTATLDDKKFIIQCKHYSENNKVWAPMIQQLNWVIVEWTESPGRIFVTTSSYTADAVSEGKKSWMELWGKGYLIKYLSEEHSTQ